MCIVSIVIVGKFSSTFSGVLNFTLLSPAAYLLASLIFFQILQSQIVLHSLLMFFSPKMTVLVTFLIPETRYPTPILKGAKVYFSRDFTPLSGSQEEQCGRETVHREQAGSSQQPAARLPFPFIPSRLQTFWVLPRTPRIKLLASASPFSHTGTMLIPG